MPGEGDGEALLRTLLQPSILPEGGLTSPGAGDLGRVNTGRQGSTDTAPPGKVPLPGHKTPDFAETDPSRAAG